MSIAARRSLGGLVLLALAGCQSSAFMVPQEDANPAAIAPGSARFVFCNTQGVNLVSVCFTVFDNKRVVGQLTSDTRFVYDCPAGDHDFLVAPVLPHTWNPNRGSVVDMSKVLSGRAVAGATYHVWARLHAELLPYITLHVLDPKSKQWSEHIEQCRLTGVSAKEALVWQRATQLESEASGKELSQQFGLSCSIPQFLVGSKAESLGPRKLMSKPSEAWQKEVVRVPFAPERWLPVSLLVPPDDTTLRETIVARAKDKAAALLDELDVERWVHEIDRLYSLCKRAAY